MQYTRRFALGAIASAVLAGCGGGGGGAATDPSAGSGAGAGTGGALGSGGTGGTPSAQGFSAFGPTVVATGASSASAPAVARLAGGGNVVLWVSGTEVRGRLTDAGGTPVGGAFVVNPGSTGAPGPIAVAPSQDGGFVVAWVGETQAQAGQPQTLPVVRARHYDAAGSSVWEAFASGVFLRIDSLLIEPIGDGYLVGWTAPFGSTANPEEAWIHRLHGDGTWDGDQYPVGVPNPDAADEMLGVAPLTDGTLVTVWRRRTLSTGEHTMFMRHFADDLNPLTSPVALPGFPASTAFPIDAEGLADGNVAIAWGTTGQNTRPFVSTAVFTPDGAPVSTVQAEVTELPASDLQVLSFGTAGYGVAWQVVHAGPRETSVSQFLWRLSLAGVPGALPEGLGTRLSYWVSPTTGGFVDAGSGADFAGGADGHYVVAAHRADTEAQTVVAGA